MRLIESAFRDFPIIDFEILDDTYKGTYLNHLGGMSGEYVRQIIPNMELARKGELDMYAFGPETLVVYIFSKNFHSAEHAGKCFFKKTHTKQMYEIPYEDIYNLMKDFLVEIEKWEKKTGKEKPGW